jgi:hypothetical protein
MCIDISPFPFVFVVPLLSCAASPLVCGVCHRNFSARKLWYIHTKIVPTEQ